MATPMQRREARVAEHAVRWSYGQRTHELHSQADGGRKRTREPVAMAVRPRDSPTPLAPRPRASPRRRAP